MSTPAVSSNLRVYDTPLKSKSSISRWASGQRTKFEAIKKQVQMAVGRHTYLADLEKFVDAMFPISDEDITAVYDNICYQGSYDPVRSEWKDKPGEGAKEEKYEQMFVLAAEATRTAYITLKHNDSSKLITQWRRYSHNVPKSLQKYASLIRPDLVLAILTRAQEDQMETLFSSIKELNALAQGEGSVDENNEKQKQLDELLAKAAIWWSRINVAVEVKRKKERTRKPIIQLLAYMERVLREQLDRRSTFGLLLLKDELSTWHLDRSGVVGTEKAFNIHKHPKLFIQIILACSFGTPESLGWDTSMRLWRGEADPNHARHSFDPDLETEFSMNLRKHWVIEMPNPDTSSANKSSISMERVAYLTIEPISIARAEIMFGRATIVWAVMRLQDCLTANHNIFVLKQAWRPAEALMESELIPKGARHVAQVVSSEEVVSHGVRVETMAYLRHGLEYTSRKDMQPQAAQQTDKARKRTQQQVDEEEKAEPRMLVLALTDVTIPLDGASDPVVNRVQTRTLLNDYGWPLQIFRDLKELLRVIEGCVRGQREIYHDHLTLQRDVSFGNILIRPGPKDDCMNTQCCIIDFDYAKKTDQRSPSLLGMSRTLPQMTADNKVDVGYERRRLSKTLQKPVPPTLDRIIWLYQSTMLDYCQDLGQLSYLPKQMPEHLHFGFLSEIDTIPEFRVLKDHQKERTGTAPFISPEILGNTALSVRNLKRSRPIYRTSPDGLKVILDEWKEYVVKGEVQGRWGLPEGTDTDPPVTSICHNAVHDLESLFWVITYICLTREGPGGRRRFELLSTTDRTPANAAIHQAHLGLFAEEDNIALSRYKLEMFQQKTYSQKVSQHFHPYFSPLKEMMDKWFNVLIMAHTWPAFEAVFDYVLAPVQQAAEEIKLLPEDPAFAPLTSKVDETRRKTLEYLHNFPLCDRDLNYSEAMIIDGSPAGKSGQQTAFAAYVDSDDSDEDLDQPPSPTPKGGKNAKRPRLDMADHD